MIYLFILAYGSYLTGIVHELHEQVIQTGRWRPLPVGFWLQMGLGQTLLIGGVALSDYHLAGIGTWVIFVTLFAVFAPIPWGLSKHRRITKRVERVDREGLSL